MGNTFECQVDMKPLENYSSTVVLILCKFYMQNKFRYKKWLDKF